MPQHFDPHIISDPLTQRFLDSTYQSLVEPDEMGQLRPALADRWERMNDRTWRFHLRSGVTLPQGEMLSAEDVVFSFERARRIGSPWRPALRSVRWIRSLEQGRTVEIGLHAPDPAWLRTLSAIKIVGRQCCVQVRRLSKREADLVDILRNSSYGTGTFQAKRHRAAAPSVSATGKESGSLGKVVLTPVGRMKEGQPIIWERIEYTSILSESERLKAVEAGKIHVALDMKHPAADTLSSTTKAAPRLVNVTIASSRLLVLVCPWLMQADRSEVLAFRPALQRQLKALLSQSRNEGWASHNAIWETLWRQGGHLHRIRDIPLVVENEASKPSAQIEEENEGAKGKKRAWKLMYTMDRGQTQEELAEIIVDVLKRNARAAELEAVEMTTMNSRVLHGQAHAALIEWMPYPESLSASLLMLVQSVCPHGLSKDAPGCSAAWSAYEGLIRSNSRDSALEGLDMLEALNQHYGWWMPLMRVMPYHVHERSVKMVPRYDGEVDFKGILPAKMDTAK